MKSMLTSVLMIILLVGGSSVSLGAGLHFDGFDKFVSIPFYPNLQVENGDFTWITFIRTDGVGGTPGEDFMVLGNREDSVYQGTNYCRLLISRQSGAAYMRYGGNFEEDLVGVTDLRDNEWHQLALVRSGNTLEMYVDGQLDSEETFSQLPVVSTDYGHRLGAAINPGGDAFRYPFVGSIDEVSIWSSALNASEIHDYFMNAPSAGDAGIEAYWAFDEATGQDVLDQVNGNSGYLGLTDGVDSHDPLRSDGYSYGGVTENMAVELDGATSYGTIPHDPIMNIGTGNFTIEAMIKGAVWPVPEPTIFSKGEGSYGTHFFMGVGNTGGNVGTVRFGAQSWTNPYGHVEVHSTYTLTVDEWHHLAGVREGNTFKIYIDGVFNAEETASLGSLSSDEIIYIGNNRTLTDFFPGCIDEVRFWNDARTPTEIAENAFVQLSGNEANLIGLWQMNHQSGSTFTDGTSYANHGTLTGSFDWVPADWGPETYNFYEVDTDTEALWRFNEDPGTHTAYDATTNNHTMTLTAGAEFTGLAAFNGSVDCTGPTAVSTNNDEIGNSWDALSIDVHFYPTVIGDQYSHPLVTRYRWHNTADPSFLLFLMPDGSLFGQVYMNDPGSIYIWGETEPGVIQTNQWYDVQMTWSSDRTLKIYVNGDLLGESTMIQTGVVRSGDDPLEVGAVYYTGYPPEFFTGYIDEVRISNVDRSLGSGGELPVDAHTQLLYHFNETPGTYTAFDATDNHHDLTLNNGAEFTPNGLFGGALDMTASAPQTANNDLVGNGWTELTIEASVYPTQLVGDFRPIVYREDWHNAGDPSYYLHVEENGSLTGGVNLNAPGTDYSQAMSDPGVIEIGQWTSIMMTWQSGEPVRLFVNGELVAVSQQVHDGFIREGDDPLGIGYVHAAPYPPDYFIGYIDEVRISDIDRSTQEPPPDGPVTLTLTPSNTSIPPGGGTLTYAVHLTSTLPDQFNNVYYWTNLILPDGSEYPQGGWLMSQHVILRPYMDVTRTGFTQNIPVFADPGEYEFQAHFGYMGGMYVSDSFMFTKLDGVSTGNEIIDWNSGGSLGLDDPELSEPLPVEWSVSEAYPNPFNPTSTIRVALPEAAELTVTVTNILGQRVALLMDGMQEAGEHALIFDAQGLASGLYFIHAHVPGELNRVQKVMLVR